MRALLVLPLLVSVVACGSSKLEKSTAEKLIKPDYPAVVRVKVPQKATVEKGSDKQQHVQKINELLNKDGWFDIQTEEKDAKVRYTYRLNAKAPKSVKPGLDNFEVPSATAEFVGATHMEPLDPRQKNSAMKVTFLVKLTKPTGQWSLYEFLHPEAKLNQPIERHALIERKSGAWELMKTDESARIKE